MKYLLFGTGEYYQRYKKWFDKNDITALLDNSKDKQGAYIDGIKVYSPQEGVKLAYDAIVILSFYIKEMKAQLIALGADESRIYHFFDLRKLLGGKAARRPVQYYGNAEGVFSRRSEYRKKILLLSHDLTLGGPALALYHAAKLLKGDGYGVVLASMMDGPLRSAITDEDIPVVIDENLQIETMNEAEWTWGFDLIFCNTFVFYVYLSERKTDIPVIWWLHDSLFFYDGADKEVLRTIDLRNMRVVSVGDVPEKAMHRYNPSMEIGSLLYGVSDMRREPTDAGRDGKIKFLTIGYVESRKGQDILLEAIKLLHGEMLEKCEFCFVGNDTSLLAGRIKEEIRHIPQVKMTGTVGRKQIEALLNGADALVCPSREDPMPTVAAEAMMHSVPCILSDVTGTSAYIKDGVDGIVFPAGDKDALAEKLRWCITHKDGLKEMGKQSRKIYESYFSMDVFKKEFLSLVEKAMG